MLTTGPDLVDIEAGVVYALERHGADMTRVIRTAGVWGIRRALAFTEYADVVVLEGRQRADLFCFGIPFCRRPTSDRFLDKAREVGCSL